MQHMTARMTIRTPPHPHRLTDNPWACDCDRMAHWRQHITNAERRGPRNQRCVTETSAVGAIFTTAVRCDDNTNQFEYGYEAKLAPRCASGPAGRPDVRDRGVYYTLRRTLRCGLTAAVRRPPPPTKPTKPTKPAAIAHSTGRAEALRRQQKRQQLELKRRRTNGLHFQLVRRRPAGATGPVGVRRPTNDDNEMGNDLFV